MQNQEMMRYEIVFSPEAEEQFAGLYRYIEQEANAEVALGYTSAVIGYCERLATFSIARFPVLDPPDFLI